MDALEFLTKNHETIKALLATANIHEEMKAVFVAMNKALDERFRSADSRSLSAT